MWIFCCTHPSRWQHDPVQAPDFADHSPVLQQSMAPLWHSLSENKAASSLANWSRMYSDLYNFHTRLPQQQQYQLPTPSSLPSRSVPSSSIFCRSWNNGTCAWRYGQCSYCRGCEKYEGEHSSVNCPFQASTLHAQPSWSPTPPRSKRQQHLDRDQDAHLFSEQ